MFTADMGVHPLLSVALFDFGFRYGYDLMRRRGAAGYLGSPDICLYLRGTDIS